MKLTEGFARVVELIGEERAAKLSQNYEGSDLYIPKMDAIKRVKRNIAIKKAFRGNGNLKELAVAFNLTTAQIRNVVYDSLGGQLPKSYLELERLIGGELTVLL